MSSQPFPKFEERLHSGLNGVILGMAGLGLVGLLFSIDVPAVRASREPAFAHAFEMKSWTELSFPDPGSLSRAEIAEHLALRMSLKGKALRSLAAQVDDLCRQHRFDPAFILAVIAVESRFNPVAVSPVGARGLMQIMPATAVVVADRYRLPYMGPSDLFDPATNLRLGVQYLEELRGQFSSVVPHFLAAYNIGPFRLQQLLAQKQFKPKGLKKYVEDVLRALGQFRGSVEWS